MHDDTRALAPRMLSFLHRAQVVLAFTGAILFSCTPPAAENGAKAPTHRYFSLEEYFEGQIQELGQSEPEIVKTVDVNGTAETKTLIIRNWRNELAAFIGSDINKAAWANSYSIDSNEHTIVYKNREPGLRTKQITLKKSKSGELSEIYIHNQVSNLLYTSEEWLRFYPDSLYEIIQEQTVRIVGENRYHIRGRLTPVPGT